MKSRPIIQHNHDELTKTLALKLLELEHKEENLVEAKMKMDIAVKNEKSKRDEIDMLQKVKINEYIRTQTELR